MTKRFDLQQFLPYQLNVAADRVSRRLARLYGAESGISMPEWRVLAHLLQSGSVSVKDIHERVDMEKSKVSRAATRLEEAGLVEKREHEEDRRLVSLSLTAAGKDLMRRLVEIADAFQAELEAELGPAAGVFQNALRQLMMQEDDHDIA